VVKAVKATSRAYEGNGFVVLHGEHPGQALLSTRLFGVIPWRPVQVQVVPKQYVSVGGQSIGVRIVMDGVLVVGYQRIASTGSPAITAHVEIGDTLEAVNNHPIHQALDISRWVNQTSGGVRLTLRRGQIRKIVQIQPVEDELHNRRLGLFVRDKTSGVGTLTFYDPQRHRFGALGHIITDADTGQPVQGKGSVFNAEVTGIVKGASGQPGEKTGRFVASDGVIGHIESNTQFGIFGDMAISPHREDVSLTPVAVPEQVHSGPATLRTVLHGQRVENFTVEIQEIVHQDTPATKSMIIHVTDPRLLKESGGIVQGMSGSPVLQDGRLIAAVTHVFVSDPTRGYGVYAYWMLNTERDNVAPSVRTAKLISVAV
jgi:stage IV sporulation protein B